MIVGAIAFTGFGVAFLCIGFLFLHATEKPYRHRTSGFIVDMCLDAVAYNSGLSGNSSTGIRFPFKNPGNRYPVFEYSVDGIKYRRAHTAAYKRSVLKKMMMQKKTVYYDPDYPEKGSLTKHTMLEVLGKSMIPTGACFLFFGFLCLICSLNLFWC